MPLGSAPTMARLAPGRPVGGAQAKRSWLNRAGAIGGGSAARLRWYRTLRMIGPEVMAAMMRSVPWCYDRLIGPSHFAFSSFYA